MSNHLDCMRDNGWSVAVHNDYRLKGEFYTFWLFTNGDRCVKGEGPSDLVALTEIVEKLVARGRERMGVIDDKVEDASRL